MLMHFIAFDCGQVLGNFQSKATMGGAAQNILECDF